MLWFLAALASWTHLLAWSLNIWRKDSKGIGEFWNAINEIRCLVISAYRSCIYEFWIYRPNIQLIYTISKTQTSFIQNFNKQYIFHYSHSFQPNLARSHDTSSNWWLIYIYTYISFIWGQAPKPPVLAALDLKIVLPFDYVFMRRMSKMYGWILGYT